MIRERFIGKSREGRAIRGVFLGDGERVLVVVAGIHGDEPLGPRLAKRLIARLRGALLDDITVVIVAEANPDGLARLAKDNARGVDLNRNFPSANWGRGRQPGYHPGARAGSEPETRAILRLARGFDARPLAILTLHEPFGFVNYDGPARLWARSIARANGYRVKASVGYPTPGSLGTYFGSERRVPVVTLELSPERVVDAWHRHAPALHAAIAAFPIGQRGLKARRERREAFGEG